MSGSTGAADERYRVEQGTDGSWLVVDRGSDRTQRTAISRESSADSAHQEARTLTALDDVTSNLGTSSDGTTEIDLVVAEATAAIDAEHNFNHLLEQRP